MDVSVILEILELVSKYGVPFVQEIFKTWNTDEVTLEDVLALKNKIKKPEEYRQE